MRLRSSQLVLSSLLVLFVLSCHATSPVPTGRLEVYVADGQGGEAGKKIEVRGTRLSELTDANGLAKFEVPVGVHVVRAYDISQGGPCCGYVDQDAEVSAAQTTRIEFFDCTECVSPAP
jgi:hypothetical protein